MARKLRKDSHAWWIHKLDGVFSKYIRFKYSTADGYCRCVTCGEIRHYKEMHAGHYVPRDFKMTRFDERNVHPQCCGCNTFHNGRMDEYALFLKRKYGEGILEELNDKKKNGQIPKTPQIKEMIGEYRQKVKQLEETVRA